jgi:hypothetical protein
VENWPQARYFQGQPIATLALVICSVRAVRRPFFFKINSTGAKSRVSLRMTILSIAALALYREPEGGPKRHGSLRRITFSGAGVARPGA